MSSSIPRWARGRRIARGTVDSNRFPDLPRWQPSPLGSRVGAHIGRFEACSTFPRVTTCLRAASPERHIGLEGSDGFVTSTAAPIATGWSDPVCRVGIAPTEDPRLVTAHYLVFYELPPSSPCVRFSSVLRDLAAWNKRSPSQVSRSVRRFAVAGEAANRAAPDSDQDRGSRSPIIPPGRSRVSQALGLVASEGRPPRVDAVFYTC